MIVPISALDLANAEIFASSKPTLFVYLERHVIRESDSVKAEITLANNSDFPLTEVNLSVSRPNFLTLQCQTQTIDCRKLGSIPARATISRNLLITSTPEVAIADYKIAFIIQYKWVTKMNDSKAVKGQSFVVVEQPLSVKFFGSDSIAGVPLSIATLIVPGLSCLLVLGLLGVPWSQEKFLGEKMLYSVLISIAILAIGSTVGSKFFPANLNPSWSISINILAFLSVGGAGIGLVIGLIDKGIRQLYEYCKTQQERKLQINPDDNDYDLLEKMLRLNQKVDPYSQVSIQLKNDQDGNQRYIGSLSAEQNDRYWLIGWFLLVPPTSKQNQSEYCMTEITNKIQVLINREDYLGALKLARQHKFAITAHEEIYSTDNNSVESTIGLTRKQWSKHEVHHQEAIASLKESPVLKICINNISTDTYASAATKAKLTSEI